MMAATDRRSPKGLVTQRSELGPTFDLMTQKGREDFRDPAQNPLMSFTSFAGSEGEQVISFAPNWLEISRRNLATLEEFARSEGAKENWLLDPVMRTSKQIDRVSLASQILETVQRAKKALKRLAVENDPDRARHFAYWAIAELSGIASIYHQWTIVAHESAIDAHIRSTKGGKDGGRAKAQKTQSRNLEMALEFTKERQTSRLSETALKEKIGKRHNLRPSAAKTAVNKGLLELAAREKLLVGKRGKPT